MWPVSGPIFVGKILTTDPDKRTLVVTYYHSPYYQNPENNLGDCHFRACAVSQKLSRVSVDVDDVIDVFDLTTKGRIPAASRQVIVETLANVGQECVKIGDDHADMKEQKEEPVCMPRVDNTDIDALTHAAPAHTGLDDKHDADSAFVFVSRAGEPKKNAKKRKSRERGAWYRARKAKLQMKSDDDGDDSSNSEESGEENTGCGSGDDGIALSQYSKIKRKLR